MMNCRHFQKHLYEYVEGSLSASAQAAADEHLAQCDACRQAVHQEEQCAQFLSTHLRQGTEMLTLRPEIRRRILTSPKSESSPPSVVGLWNRLAWPLGIAASLLLTTAIVLVNHYSRSRVDVCEIQISYRVPTHQFRKVDNLVLDTMSEETVVIDETLREIQERKTPL
jgi:anti-sigma factor RsiW